MVTTPTLAVHPGNLPQLRAWDGAEGAFWAAHAATFERSVAGFDPPFLAAAGIGSADRVLDVGCGTGSTTRAAARLATAGSALGVDLSSAMLARARRAAREEGLRNVEFLQADAQVHPFAAAAFDVAVSRTAVMFFTDRVAALANIGRALRPGGRLALLVWQSPQRNEWFVELTTALAAGRQVPAPPPGAPHPFSLADPGTARSVVEAAGYTDVSVQGLDGGMWLGPDAGSAHDLAAGLLGFLLDGLDDDRRQGALRALRRTVEAHTGPDGVRFSAAAWLVTGRRGAGHAVVDRTGVGEEN